MSNMLPNGTVLPSGMLSASAYKMGDAHKKTFENYSLKPGIVVQAYAPNDSGNVNKKVAEYDVLAFEQDGNKSSTTIKYKNCIVMSAFGSIADYFEANIRRMETNSTPSSVPTPSGQDGSIVLLLCMNGLSDKGVIIGCLSHPARPTNLTDTNPHLVGEYNGVQIAVNENGSAVLTFNGATNNSGVPLAPLVAPTTITIATNGSVSISSQQSVSVNCKEANVIATDTAIVDGTTVKLGANAAQSVILGDLFMSYFNTHTHATVFGPSSPPIVPMENSLLSAKVVSE